MLDKYTITKTAQKFAAKGQIHKAIEEWEKLLKESRDGNVYNIIGDLYLKKREKRDAVAAFTKAANIFREDGFYLKAIALYKKVLNISPIEVEALIALAELNTEKGLIGNANEHYLSAAEVYMKEGSTEKALGIYEEVLKLIPSNINLRLKIADLYLKIDLKNKAVEEYLLAASDYLDKGEHEKAQQLYVKVVGFQPDNVSASIGLSRVAENTGNIQQAYEYLESAMSSASGDKDLLLNYSRLAFETGNLDNSKKALTELIEIDPSNNRNKKLLGDIYLKEGSLDKAWENLLPYIDETVEAERWDETLELLDYFKEIDPVEVKRRLVIIYKGKNDEDAAINELRALTEIFESKDLAHDALQSYKEILELKPDDSAVQDKIKELEGKLGIEEVEAFHWENKSVEEALPKVDEQIHHGQVRDAISHLEKLKEKDKDNSKILTRLKDLYIESDEKDKAIGECLALAELYEKNGDLEAKNNLIAEAAGLNPDDPRLVAVTVPSPEIKEDKVSSEKVDVPPSVKPSETFEEELAEANFYAQQGLVDEAIGIFEKLLPLSPDKEEVIKKLRELKPEWMPGEEPAEKTEEDTKIDKDLKDVFSEFKKGIEEELGEQDSETRYNLGIAYKEMGLLDDAIREFKIVAKDPKKNMQSLSMLALCYMDKKLYPLAIQEYKRLMESMGPADDGYLEAKCGLADAYVKNEDYAKAVKLYMEIYSQSPKFRDVAHKVEIVKKLEFEAKNKPKSKKDRVSYI